MFQAIIIIPYLFILAFVAFYIPGSLLIKNLPLKPIVRVVASCVVGAALWGWQAWIFGWLSVRFCTYLYLCVAVAVWIKHTSFSLNFSFKRLIVFLRREKLIILFLLVGLIMQLPSAWFFGLVDKQGFSLVSGMSPDLEWHAALTYQLTKAIPPNQPALYGVIVKNYHYFGNMIMGEFVRIFQAPLIITVFQFFSILLSLFFGLSAVAFARTYNLGKKIEAILLVLLYLGGDLNPIVTLLLGKGFHFRMGAMESGGDMLTNYPRIFSAIFVFIFLTLLKPWIQKQNVKIEIILALLLSAAVGSKVNTGALILIGLGTLTIYFMYKRQYKKATLFCMSCLFTVGIFLPVNSSAGGLIYTGFWRAQDYIVHPELGLSRLELARRVYEEHNNILPVLAYNMLFLSIYVFATFGTKLLIFVQTRKSVTAIPLFIHIVLISGMIVCFIMGMFFIQASGGSNSFNFLSTVFIFSSIYAALGISFAISRINSSPLRYSLLLLFLLLTASRSVYNATVHYQSYFGSNRPVLPVNIMELYRYIKDEIPKNAVFLRGDYPLSYLGEKDIYLPSGNSKGVLLSHGIDVFLREGYVEQLMKEPDLAERMKSIRKLGIQYAFTDTDTGFISTMSSELFSSMHAPDDQKIIYFR